MNIEQAIREKALEQFDRRKHYADFICKIDNQGLHAGDPMYFYCEHCGTPTEVLPEDFIFPPIKECSQCLGLKKLDLLDLAKKV